MRMDGRTVANDIGSGKKRQPAANEQQERQSTVCSVLLPLRCAGLDRGDEPTLHLQKDIGYTGDAMLCTQLDNDRIKVVS